MQVEYIAMVAWPWYGFPLRNHKMAADETTDTEVSSNEEDLQEAREAVKLHNRKKKKSGGFQSMG